MDYCGKWMLVGLAIGYLPIITAILASTFVARLPASYLIGAVLSGATLIALLVMLRPASLILWNAIRPATCNGIN